MPRCLICDSSYETLSWSGPSEPCDCGACFSRANWCEPANEGFDLKQAQADYRAYVAADCYAKNEVD